MSLRMAEVSPTDRHWAKDRGLDNATYTANHRISLLIRRGKIQWKIKPGSVVVPCSVWRVLAVVMVSGICLRCTFKCHSLIAVSSLAPMGCAVTGTRKLLESWGSMAT